MLINDIKAKSYKQSGSSLEIVLQCDINTALNIDDSLIKVTTDEGSVTDVFSGYTRVNTSLDAMSGYVTVRYEVVDGILAESLASVSSAIKNSMQASNDAKQTADEAKQIAEQAGTDPQVQTIARLAMPSIDFASVTATDVVSIPDYIPEWSTLIGQKLKQNSPCRYNGIIYRASQDVTVQDIYPPDVAGESQYYPIEVAPDGIIVYRTCHGDYDKVRKGELRHYPDAEGPVYRAKVDTSYSPDAYPDDWELA